MNFSPFELALINGGFLIAGVLLGAFITCKGALKLSDKNARREAGRRLREAFTPELATLHPVSGDKSLTPAVIEERLRTAFPRHRVAILEFSFESVLIRRDENRTKH